MAVAIGLSPFGTHLFESHTRRRLNSVRGRPGHSVPPCFQGFHPLGLVPQGDAGNPQQERFFLDSAGVGQDQPGVPLKDEHLMIGDRRNQADRPGGRPSSASTPARRSALARLYSSESYITSPTRWTPVTMPSQLRFFTARSVGQNSSAERWSVTTRLISSGIARL